MKAFIRIPLYLLLLLSAAPLTAQSIAFTHAVVVGSHVGHLSWNHCSGVTTYRLHRQLPDQTDFIPIASLTDTFYSDTLHRTLCGDTVSYFVEGFTETATIQSSPEGLFFQDNNPTAPCALRLCSVDTALSRIRLSWYPSPDTDVMGYYICMGSPCRDYDTVWGRLNTSYLCPETLTDSTSIEYCFRILAFDSCFQASPLTPYYHNPHLTMQTDTCSRQVHCVWNRYVNMPDSVKGYTVHYLLDGDSLWREHRVGADGSFEFDTLIDDLSVRHMRAYLSVDNFSDSLRTLSRCVDLYFDYGDTADYLRIAELQYDDRVPTVTLTLEVDPYFSGSRCFLYRTKGFDGTMEQIAEFSRNDIPRQQFFTYTDSDISRIAGRYVYQIGVPDICNQWIKYSDTVQLILPDISQPEAYFPNVIVYGDAEMGLFCPRYISPLVNDYTLDIYSRMGLHLFHTNRIDDCWDGTATDGSPLSQGVYVYKSMCRHSDGSRKTYIGTVLVLR